MLAGYARGLMIQRGRDKHSPVIENFAASDLRRGRASARSSTGQLEDRSRIQRI